MSTALEYSYLSFLLARSNCSPSSMDLQKWVHYVQAEELESGVIDGSVSSTESPEDNLITILDLVVACLAPSLERRPTMRHVLRMIEEVKEHSASS